LPRVPNAEQAVIDPRKFTEYLLSKTSLRGASRAKFFESFGFSKSNWRQLQDAFFKHLLQHDYQVTWIASHRVVYEVVGRITSPDGRNPRVRVVW